MRIAFVLLWMGVSVLGAGGLAAGLPEEIQRLHGVYEGNQGRVAAARQQRVRALDEKYLVSLETLRKQARRQGRLDGVLAVEAEIGRVAKGAAVPEEGDGETFEPLARSRAVYRAARKEEDTRTARLAADLSQKYRKALEWQERELMRQGLAAAAAAVRGLRHEVLGKELYMVVDLSGGKEAEFYPVSYLAEVPEGGWTDVYKTDKLVLRKIKAGTFEMGSPESEVGRNPRPSHEWTHETLHRVTLTHDYYIGVFEVTQRQWERVMGDRPSFHSNEVYWMTRPVESGANYERIRGQGVDFGAPWPHSHRVGRGSFLQRLRDKTGLETFDLPTEAQWEYACRAGTKTALNNGKDLVDCNRDPVMDTVGRYKFNKRKYERDSASGTAMVGSYAPNAWGLYDMHGNVWEWCLDRREAYAGEAVDPQGAADQTRWDFVRRGGSIAEGADSCRSALRYWNYFGNKYNDIGFRLAMTVR